MRAPLHCSNAAGTLVVAAVFATGCLSRPAADPAETGASTTTTHAAAEPRCASAPAQAVAILEASPELGGARARRCGVALTLADGELAVSAIPQVGDGVAALASGGGSAIAEGPVPPECGPALERCELWGLDDGLGPIVIVAARGPESEVPVQVHVGWVEGDRLGFAPTWYGLPSVADHTRVGPAWALAPFDCDGALRLLPVARLPEAEAEVEGVDEAVIAAAGRWTIGEGEASLAEAGGEPRRCRRIPVAVP